MNKYAVMLLVSRGGSYQIEDSISAISGRQLANQRFNDFVAYAEDRALGSGRQYSYKIVLENDTTYTTLKSLIVENWDGDLHYSK